MAEPVARCYAQCCYWLIMGYLILISDLPMPSRGCLDCWRCRYEPDVTLSSIVQLAASPSYCCWLIWCMLLVGMKLKRLWNSVSGVSSLLDWFRSAATSPLHSLIYWLNYLIVDDMATLWACLQSVFMTSPAAHPVGLQSHHVLKS